jgi:hypothetical protein
MNVPLHQKLELAFWDVAIDFLTQSTLVRSIVRKSVEIRRSPNFRWYASVIVTGGLFGFLLGVAVPLFLQTIR